MHVNMDPNFVDNMVNEVKSQGVFDAFRKDSMSDVDTKPAYQNLKQRVENTVGNFLSGQKWTPDLNKNQLRERLRKHIIEAGFLDVGVQRIVDQVVNPKISTVFQPKIEEIIYKYLGIDKPETKNDHKSNQLNINGRNLSIKTDLLPTDLEAVSPDSDKSKSEQLHERENYLDDEDDDDESPPFEPLEAPSLSKIKEDEISNHSHLSGLSGLTSQESIVEEEIIINTERNEDIKIEDNKNDNVINSSGEYTQESQLSQVSSNSRLSIVTNEEDTNEKKKQKMFVEKDTTTVDISEEAQMPKFNENSNSCPPTSSESLHFDIKKDEIKFEGTDRNAEILPPVYQTEMLENSDENARTDTDRQMITRNIEEISNGTFKTDSQDSSYFDDDSEKGVLQIVEEPTQDMSQQKSQPTQVIFHKPELSTDNLPILVSKIGKKELTKKSEYFENRPITPNKYNDDLDLVERSLSSTSQHQEDKHTPSKSHSNREHSSRHTSHKKHSRDKKSKDNRINQLSDTKISASSLSTSEENYHNNKHSNSRHSSQSSISSPIKENKDNKTSGSTIISPSQKNKSTRKSEKHRKRDYDHNNDDDKPPKSDKNKNGKSKENDDHSSERNKLYRRKSTDSNDEDKKGDGLKSNKNAKDQFIEKNNNGRNSSGLVNQENSPNTDSTNDSEALTEPTLQSSDALTLKMPHEFSKKCENISDPVIIDNLSLSNIEVIIGVKSYPNQNDSLTDDLNQASEQINSTCLNASSLDSRINSVSSITNKKSPEKARFETLISPPPKKRKYDMNFYDHLSDLPKPTPTKIFVPTIDFNDLEEEEADFNGFVEMKLEQSEYNNNIKLYEELFDSNIPSNFLIGIPNEPKTKHSSNKKSKKSIDTPITKRKRENDLSELCHTTIISEEIPLPNKTLSIDCFSYNDVANMKRKTKIQPTSTEICPVKVSPTLSESSVSSKENDFAKKKLNQTDSDIKYFKKDVRNNNIPTIHSTQRYTCDELYKPRSVLSQRSRRRGLENDII